MFTTRYKASIDRFLHPVAARLARSGVAPSAITIATPCFISVICWFFLATRAVLPFCFAVTVAGCLDGLDGAVARAGGRSTRFGAYLDAMADRYVESLVVLSVAHVTGHWALSTAFLVGALLVSYAKARAAMEVAISNQEWPDLMERVERGLLFIAGLAASAVVPWKPFGHDLFWWTLGGLTALTHLTVLQRMFRARRLIQQRTPSPRTTA